MPAKARIFRCMSRVGRNLLVFDASALLAGLLLRLAR
jgi:hypothetical protein